MLGFLVLGICGGNEERFGGIGNVFDLLLESLVGGGLSFMYVEKVGIEIELCKFIVFWLYFLGDIFEIFFGIGYFGGCEEDVGEKLLLFLLFIFIVIFNLDCKNLNDVYFIVRISLLFV